MPARYPRRHRSTIQDICWHVSPVGFSSGCAWCGTHPTFVKFIFFFIFFSEETNLDVWLVVTTAHGTGYRCRKRRNRSWHSQRTATATHYFKLLPEADPLLFTLSTLVSRYPRCAGGAENVLYTPLLSLTCMPRRDLLPSLIVALTQSGSWDRSTFFCSPACPSENNRVSHHPLDTAAHALPAPPPPNLDFAPSPPRPRPFRRLNVSGLETPHRRHRSPLRM